MALRGMMCVSVLLILLLRETSSQLSVCGKPPLNTKIVGGQTAPDGSWPWQVSLHAFGGHLCGGSLINNQWVLSAAHCFQGGSASASALTVYVGRQTQGSSNPNEVSRSVSMLINHPNYNSATNDNDIALLKLSSTVTFTDYIMPVCLAESGSSVHSGEVVWVTGWGALTQGGVSPDELNEVDVPIVGNRQCNCDNGVGTITNNMICAGLREGGKDSCQGDSGGPLVIKQGDQWIQLGVVSFGTGCALPNLPGVYARVSSYMTWINEQITSNQPGFVIFTSSGTDSDLSVTCSGLPTVPPTTPQPVVCGNAPKNTRFIGGSSVDTAGMWPWMASLQKSQTHMCGGTLVAVDAVLSDADCFNSSAMASEWNVVLGRLNQNGSNPFEVTLNVTNITMSNLNGSNVAVLHLSPQPTLSDYIQPICLDNGLTFSVGTTCWVTGWSTGQGGNQQALQEKQISVVDCGNSSSSDSLCTGSVSLEQGDAGGPLMCKQDSSWFQASVLTLANSTSTRANAVSVFTKMSRFQSFLSQTLGTLLSPASSANTTNTTNTTNTGGGSSFCSPFISLHLLLLICIVRIF